MKSGEISDVSEAPGVMPDTWDALVTITKQTPAYTWKVGQTIMWRTTRKLQECIEWTQMQKTVGIQRRGLWGWARVFGEVLKGGFGTGWSPGQSSGITGGKSAKTQSCGMLQALWIHPKSPPEPSHFLPLSSLLENHLRMFPLHLCGTLQVGFRKPNWRAEGKGDENRFPLSLIFLPDQQSSDRHPTSRWNKLKLPFDYLRGEYGELLAF